MKFYELIDIEENESLSNKEQDSTLIETIKKFK